MTAKVSYTSFAPVIGTIGEMRYTGKWYATKEKIVVKIDKNSIEIKLKDDLLSPSEREEFEQNILKNMRESGFKEIFNIKRIKDYILVVTDDDGEEHELIGVYSPEEEQAATLNDKTVISGDFDGDGQEDHLWIEGEGTDDYEPVEFVLCSDNPRLDGQTWTAIYGVDLYNVGKLDDSGRDFLGVVPVCMSNWEAYLVYGFRNGWNESLEPISMFSDNGRNNRVTKSSTPGYVVIREDKMDFDNGGLESVCREVRLN